MHQLTSSMLAIVATLFSFTAAAAQDTTRTTTTAARSHDQAPTATAARRNGPISIDGRMDEAAWQAAQPVTNFTQIDPQEGQPVSERTEARILFDDAAIYVAFRNYDREPQRIQANLARRDESSEGDLVELSLDTYHDHLSGYVFRLSAAGARRDAAILPPFGQTDNSWDAVWEGSTSIDSLGWTAEFRIPLSQLRFNARAPEQMWGIQLGRRIGRRAEVAFFSFTPKNQQQGVNRYGHLTGLGRLSSRRRVEAVPYVLAKNEHPSVPENDPLRDKNDIVPGMGLDLKYSITSNLTLDATFNPDFGQVEVDPAVVNLSAFETFFPERRPFFVEGAGIFAFGQQRTQNRSGGFNFAHFRRIGRQPQRFLSGPNFTVVDAPLETTIAAATKLTGRTARGWSIGVLDALTMREEARFVDTLGAVRRTTVEPRTNYFVGRLKRDFRQGNTTVGFGATAVNRALEDDPALESLFRRAAYVAGVDWQHAWANRTYAFDGLFAYSYNQGSTDAISALQLSSARYLQRPDRESRRFDPTRTALGGHVGELTFAKLSGKWRGSVTYQDYNPGFEVNEAGFLGQTDMRSIAPLISYSENTPGRLFRNWSQFLFWNPTWNYDDDMTFNGVGSITAGEFRNFWTFFLRLDWRPPIIDDRLTRGGPVAAFVESGGVQLELNSDRRKPYTYGIFSSYSWNEAGGRGVTLSPRMQVRPSTALRINFNPEYRRTHSMAQFVTRVTDATATDTYGARYVFATLAQKQLALVTRVDWTFSPTLSLQLFAQPLLASADFRDYKELDRPRSFDFDIYGQDAGTITRNDATGRYTVDPDGPGPAASFSFSERDFNRRSLRGNAVLRWEYRPGSALFFVWQQSRFAQVPIGEFDFSRDFEELWQVRPENVFVVKATWWLSR